MGYPVVCQMIRCYEIDFRTICVTICFSVFCKLFTFIVLDIEVFCV